MRAARLGLCLQGVGLVPLVAFIVTGQTSSPETWRACAVVGLCGILLMLAGVAIDLVAQLRSVKGGR